MEQPWYSMHIIQQAGCFINTKQISIFYCEIAQMKISMHCALTMKITYKTLKNNSKLRRCFPVYHWSHHHIKRCSSADMEKKANVLILDLKILERTEIYSIRTSFFKNTCLSGNSLFFKILDYQRSRSSLKTRVYQQALALN